MEKTAFAEYIEAYEFNALRDALIAEKYAADKILY